MLSRGFIEPEQVSRLVPFHRREQFHPFPSYGFDNVKNPKTSGRVAPITTIQIQIDPLFNPRGQLLLPGSEPRLNISTILVRGLK